MISLLYRSPRPLVTYLLILINAVVFLYEVGLSDIESAQFTYKYGLIPHELTTGTEIEAVSFGRRTLDIASPIPPWGTMFTSMFVHAGIMHFALNMLFLWVAGEKAEPRIGHITYLLFYLIAGVVAVWAQVGISQGSFTPLVGASGAISGILGVYLVAFPLSHTTFFIGFWFIMQLFNGLGSVAPAASGAGVAYMAHVGGFIAGVALMLAYKVMKNEPLIPRRPRWYGDY